MCRLGRDEAGYEEFVRAHRVSVTCFAFTKATTTDFSLDVAWEKLDSKRTVAAYAIWSLKAMCLLYSGGETHENGRVPMCFSFHLHLLLLFEPFSP